MEYDNIDWLKYGDKSLAFVLEQSEKSLNESIKVFREMVSKTYITLAVLLSTETYSLNKIIDQKTFSFLLGIPYLLIMIGMSASIFILWKNIFPAGISFPGSVPNTLIHPYFESFDDDNKIRMYQRTKIIDYHESIKTNNIVLDGMVKRYKYGLNTALITGGASFIIAIFFWFLSA